MVKIVSYDWTPTYPFKSTMLITPRLPSLFRLSPYQALMGASTSVLAQSNASKVKPLGAGLSVASLPPEAGGLNGSLSGSLGGTPKLSSSPLASFGSGNLAVEAARGRSEEPPHQHGSGIRFSDMPCLTDQKRGIKEHD